MNCADIAELAPLYVAGELDPKRAAEFDAHLRVCPACMRELESQSRVDTQLREALLNEEISVAAVNRRVIELISAGAASNSLPQLQSKPRRRWATAAIGVAAVFLLFAAGYLLVPARAARVYADAAFDHRLEVVEHGPRTWVIDQSKIDELLVQQGIPAGSAPPVLAASYHLREAKICRLDGRSFIHLVYSDGSAEFSLYLRLRDGHSVSGPVRGIANGRLLHVSTDGAEHISSFETARLTVMVVTDQPAGASLRFARAASSAL